MINYLTLLAMALLSVTFDNGEMPYFNVGKDFSESHKNMCIGPNCFGYAIAVRGGESLWVCSTNSAIEFADTFALYSFDTVMLSVNDFPQDSVTN